jgi:hypothetical protein
VQILILDGIFLPKSEKIGKTAQNRPEPEEGLINLHLSGLEESLVSKGVHSVHFVTECHAEIHTPTVTNLIAKRRK